jgi:hypothetical protein
MALRAALDWDLLGKIIGACQQDGAERLPVSDGSRMRELRVLWLTRPDSQTGPVKWWWLPRLAAWQYAMVTGFCAWPAAFGVATLLNGSGPNHQSLSRVIINVSAIAASTTTGSTLGRQIRLRGNRPRPRYSEPGPMLRYAGLTPIPDTSEH